MLGFRFEVGKHNPLYTLRHSMRFASSDLPISIMGGAETATACGSWSLV